MSFDCYLYPLVLYERFSSVVFVLFVNSYPLKPYALCSDTDWDPCELYLGSSISYLWSIPCHLRTSHMKIINVSTSMLSSITESSIIICFPFELVSASKRANDSPAYI